jgi:hypothetical protein
MVRHREAQLVDAGGTSASAAITVGSSILAATSGSGVTVGGSGTVSQTPPVVFMVG